MKLLTHILKTVFGFQKGAKLTACAYSIVTTPRDELLPIQCLPHYDGTDSTRLAILHYLSSKEHGGTSFFRHRATGYETITENRFEEYKTCLEAEVAEIGSPEKTYFNESSSQFEIIGTVEAVVNRCILYRGITLHPGVIPKTLVLNDNPSNGRLTINTFMISK